MYEMQEKGALFIVQLSTIIFKLGYKEPKSRFQNRSKDKNNLKPPREQSKNADHITKFADMDFAPTCCRKLPHSAAICPPTPQT